MPQHIKMLHRHSKVKAIADLPTWPPDPPHLPPINYSCCGTEPRLGESFHRSRGSIRHYGGRFNVAASSADMICYCIRWLKGSLGSGCLRGSSATTHLHQDRPYVGVQPYNRAFLQFCLHARVSKWGLNCDPGCPIPWQIPRAQLPS